MSTTNTLTWNKNVESDLAGYNVYRRIGSAPLKGDVKVNSVLVPGATPTYVDSVSVDGDYFYAVTAVDTAGNESAFSNVVDKVVNTVPPSAPTGLAVA
jgi:fibronectin type 3 domain-containing protein